MLDGSGGELGAMEAHAWRREMPSAEAAAVLVAAVLLLALVL